MNERLYSDFDLVIEQTGDRYRARVINSPAGQASVEFKSIISPLELENFVLRMGRPRSGMRRIDSPDLKAAKEFGKLLFTTIFSGEVNTCYLRSYDQVRNQNMGLRVRLHINVPEFHDLPWEFLYNPRNELFVALTHPIIRYIELSDTTRALSVQTPLRVLVMLSSPEEYPRLDIEKEWEKLNKALEPLLEQGLVTLDRLERPTLSALQKKLRQDKVHIFHYIGHGKYFEDRQDGMLLLEDEYGHGIPTSGQRLGAILHNHYHLRLVVLNACEGARTSKEDPYTGVAQTLVRQGIPAVLAMQFEIFENAAITFAEEFYSAIVDNYPVDAALSEARRAIFATENDVEWGTPVLFMRTPDGILFKPESPDERTVRLEAEEKIAHHIAEQKAREKAKQEEAEKEQRERDTVEKNKPYKPKSSKKLPVFAGLILMGFLVLCVGALGWGVLSSMKAIPFPFANNTLISSPTKIILTPSRITPSLTHKPTSTPTLRPTSTPKSDFSVYISVTQANIYQGPGLGYYLAKSDTYQKGDKFTVIARNKDGDWLLCKAQDGGTGWLFIDWVDMSFDHMAIPTASSIPPVPPTPTRRPKNSH